MSRTACWTRDPGQVDELPVTNLLLDIKAACKQVATSAFWVAGFGGEDLSLKDEIADMDAIVKVWHQ